MKPNRVIEQNRDWIEGWKLIKVFRMKWLSYVIKKMRIIY